jgi:hypothetical protein
MATQTKTPLKPEFSQADLKHLINLSAHETVCVSIYCPTHRAGTAIQQDPIRLKNLVRQAETQLTEQGMDAEWVARFLQPMQSLLVKESEDEFWQHQQDGLAFFVTKDHFEIYQLSIPVEPEAFVGHRFFLKPLVPLLMQDNQFYLLALSQNQVRLMAGDRDRIHEVELAGIPGSLAEALRYDEPERQIQYHTGTSGRVRPVYHGHGVGTTDNKDEIRRYLQQVNRGIHDMLSTATAPLVLAGVDYILAMYREVSDYPNILAEEITGNPDELTMPHLHQQAWQIVAPYFERSHQQAIAKFHDYRGTGQATEQLEDIVLASYHGQVDTLLIAVNQQRWGQFDPQSNRIELHHQRAEEDDELLNLATINTLANSGVVYILEPDEMPGDGAIAAIFRYPIVAGTGV